MARAQGRRTPLHFAAGAARPYGAAFFGMALNGSEACCAALLEVGADPDPRDAKGRTPAMVAFERGALGSVAALAEAGAEVGFRGSVRSTPAPTPASAPVRGVGVSGFGVGAGLAGAPHVPRGSDLAAPPPAQSAGGASRHCERARRRCRRDCRRHSCLHNTSSSGSSDWLGLASSSDAAADATADAWLLKASQLALLS